MFPPFRDLFVYQVFADLVMMALIVHVLIYVRLSEQQRSVKPLICSADLPPLR